ncbi:hypothetical protein [Helicobacter pullorum]|uniref:hypothetical protein n=1 Tax=Helicobacter pullorum TaxID=35818 RepID=UPI000816A7CD|nr:hypothetical protein [Helicobacter pullorum]OCR15001.1 hypothetical protein BA915_06195 [Helicobacter pullorum]
MTAYVHIGTEKTGTTSIQYFLAKNDENWLKKGFVYVESIRKNGQHWVLTDLLNIHCLKVKNEQQKLFYQDRMEKLKQEVRENKNKIFIFSSEGLTWALDLTQIKPVKALNDLLYSLGFSDIKIILYLRNQADLMVSASSENIKSHQPFYAANTSPSKFTKTPHTYDFKNIIQKYGEVFGKENLIVRLFDKNEFKDGDLLKDFVDAIGLKWDDSFIIPENQNETLDLIGFELGKRINSHFKNVGERNLCGVQLFASPLYFSSKDKELKFMPKKEHYQIWNDYFEETNEWVRKEFFPYKERLFPKKDLSNYKENYELKEMKPEYWDRIAKFIVDLAKDRKKIIDDKDKLIAQKDQIIQTKNQELESKTEELTSKTQQLTQTKNQLDTIKVQLDSTKQQLDSKVKELDSKTKELSSLHTQKQTLEIKNLEQDNLLKQIQIQEAKQDLINKQLHAKQLEKELGYEANVLKELEIKNQQLTQTKNQLDSTKKQLESANKILSSNPNTSHLIQNTSYFKGKLAYLNTLATAKDRIHNHLSYKLGKAMIENSKSILGYIRMPYVLSYIKEQHNKEQKQYQEAIKKNPNLKLPNLESYPDYQESLKEKECFTYKLGEAFMKANKTWYKGGYVKLLFEAKRLEREYREKRVERG